MDNEITINGEVYVKKDNLTFAKVIYEDGSEGEAVIDPPMPPKFNEPSKLDDRPHSVGKNIECDEQGRVYVKKPWPQEGDEFFTVYGDGTLAKGEYDSKVSWKRRSKERGNIFQTEEEAKMYSLRIESLSKGFMPKEDENFWAWNFSSGRPEKGYIMECYLLEPKFPTKEECQEWGDEYGSAWNYPLNKNNS